MCTACGRRQAVYHRRYSGERLCLQCLRESLHHKVRRAIARYQLLTPESNVLAVVRSGVTVDELGMSLLLEVERDFPKVRISFLAIVDGERPVNCLYLKTAILEATRRGIEKVVLPLTAEETVANNLLWISGRGGCLLLRGRLLYPDPPDGLDVVLPLYDVLGWELAAAFQQENTRSSPMLDLVFSLEDEFPGSTYNMLRSMERLADARGGIL